VYRVAWHGTDIAEPVSRSG